MIRSPNEGKSFEELLMKTNTLFIGISLILLCVLYSSGITYGSEFIAEDNVDPDHRAPRNKSDPC